MRGTGRIPIPLSRRVNRFRQLVLPFVLWVVALAAVIVLAEKRTHWMDTTGVVESKQAMVASVMDGVLRGVAVDLFDRVYEGQVIATLDDSVLRAELYTLERQVAQIRAELAAAEVQYLLDRQEDPRSWMDDTRRFALDEEEARLDYLDRQTQQEILRVRLVGAQLALSREEALVEAGALDEAALDSLRALRDEIQIEIESGEEGLEFARERIRQTADRRATFGVLEALPLEDLETLLEPYRLAINVEESRANELRAAQESLILRAPCSGLVNQVLRRSGESIAAGEPVVMITDPRAGRVVAYLEQGRAHRVTPGLHVEIRRRTAPIEISRAEILRVGPGFEELPLRAQTVPGRISWGLPILIAISPDVDFLPGEIVGVRVPIPAR